MNQNADFVIFIPQFITNVCVMCAGKWEQILEEAFAEDNTEQEINSDFCYYELCLHVNEEKSNCIYNTFCLELRKLAEQSPNHKTYAQDCEYHFDARKVDRGAYQLLRYTARSAWEVKILASKDKYIEEWRRADAKEMERSMLDHAFAVRQDTGLLLIASGHESEEAANIAAHLWNRLKEEARSIGWKDETSGPGRVFEALGLPYL